MIDPLNEELISFRELCRKLPGRDGKQLNIATVYRWAQKGRKGVRLKSVFVGGTRYTSANAVLEFFNKIDAAEQPEQPKQPTPRQRRQAFERARRELDREGL